MAMQNGTQNLCRATVVWMNRAVGGIAVAGLAACVTSETGTGGAGSGRDVKQKTVVVVTPFGFGFATKAKEKERKPLSPEQIAAAAIIAGGIVKQLRAVANDCKRLNKPEYEIDCLSEGYSRATRGIPDDDALGDARGAVSKAATALAELAAANRAADLPAIRSGKQARAVTAIEPARLTAARAKAAEIIGETQTVLLRSAESSDLRESYQKIAVSLDTGKALLRS